MFCLRSLLPTVILGCLATHVEAQVSRYEYRWEPSQPIVAPYESLWRTGVETLRTRQTFLQVQRRQEQRYRGTTEAIDRNSKQILRLADDVKNMPSAAAQRSNAPAGVVQGSTKDQVGPPRRTVRPTGTGSVFRSYSQYFPRWKSSQGPLNRMLPIPRWGRARLPCIET